MDEVGAVVWTSGLLTWVIGQDVVLADDVASQLFGLDPEDCRTGTRIETFLSQVTEADRSRVANNLFRSIAEGSDYLETFDVETRDGLRRLVAKGSSVGDVLFSCIVTECVEPRFALKRLCLAAYEVARQENNDPVAYCLMQSVVALEGATRLERLH